MKPLILTVLLGFSTVLAGYTVFSKVPKRLVLGWLGVGLCQSVFFLVVGFELLALLNLLFVFASGTVLQIFSALFGTAAIHESEKQRTRKDWIYGIGTGLTAGAILGFAHFETIPAGTLTSDLETSIFAKAILNGFPELPWVLGVTLFFGIVVWSAVGRPGWKRAGGGQR